MKTLRRIAILFFGVVFAISLFMLARILVQGRQEQAAFDRLSAALEQPESADGQNPEQSPYEALKAQNPDFFGWISIEGTNIDYGDQLITLSTCTNRSQDERFVVVGRQIQHQDS